jgi:alpha-galactosidase
MKLSIIAISRFFFIVGLSLAGLAPLAAQEIPAALKGADAPANSIWLESLDLSQIQQGYGKPGAGRSVDGNALTLNGTVYPHGVGTHAKGRILVDLHGAATRFEAVAGVDDEKKGLGSITIALWVDGKKAVETPILHGGDAPQVISADLTGAKQLLIVIGNGRDGYVNDHADLAGAFVTLAAGATQKPEMVSAAIVQDPPRLKIVPEDPKPAIHGARTLGSTPGHPLLFTIPATGTGPLEFSADNLPEGLKIDSKTGIISGSLAKAGTTKVTLHVKGPDGEAQRDLTFIGGEHKLGQTPQMGWNSWNVWGNTVSDKKIRDAADEFFSAGLIRHGYRFVNIDQGWPGKRDAQGFIQSNDQFPDMKKLADDLHAKGINVGLYSSPGPQTCGPYEGSYQHEEQDAETYAKWGFDYLKYDWCSYDGIVNGDHSLESCMKPYRIMGQALAKQDRDIYFSLCQYGMADSWKWAWGPEVLGNSWRTNTDLLDKWSGDEGGADNHCGVYDALQDERGHEKYNAPGHWNDPDMLEVGIVGFGNTHPSGLSQNEQISHFSMWCMLSAPLLIGCDMTRFDDFTKALLTNDEAIDINQDPLGKTAVQVVKTDEGEVWSRELFDGTRGVALLNPAPVEEKITVKWSDIGLSGKQAVRDLWLHQDEGTFDGEYSAMVPSHGTVLLKIGTAAR